MQTKVFIRLTAEVGIGVWGVAPPTESESLKSALKFPLKPPRAIDAGQNPII